MTMHQLINILLDFAFYYPLFMAYLWMVGGIYYRTHWETWGGYGPDNPPPLDAPPPVSILVPCHNEGRQIEETVAFLIGQNYPDFEIIAINDGSSDDTGAILDELQAEHPRLRVVHLGSNQGKGMALRTGAMLARHEYLVCIDGDALLEPNATRWLIRNLCLFPRVGAVTGNPRIRNRSTILGKLQVGEFSSIIGMIKRAQRIYGRIFTVSGVVVAFRKTALQRIGYWNTDMVTEDIDISWRLQLDHWDIHYEPNALCWILMPETFSGLWRQRVRWAQGGAETALRHFSDMLHWRKRRMWIIMAEYGISVAWSFIVTMIVVMWLLSQIFTLPAPFNVPTIVPGWTGVVLGMTCLLQFVVSLSIDSRYEKGLLGNFFWIVWYPLAYWMMNAGATVGGVIKALLRRRRGRATWKSPDRGIQ